jgi:hypothetical protein
VLRNPGRDVLLKIGRAFRLRTLRYFVKKMANTTNWTLLPISVNARGNKNASILENGKPLKIKLHPTTAPFGAGLFNDNGTSTRLNLDLQCDEVYLEFCTAVDEWCIEQLTSRSTEFFKTKKSRAEVEAIFKPSATPHCSKGIEYAPTLRTKINTLGTNAIRCWNPDKTVKATPECGLDWKGATITPEILIKSIWFMQGACGVVYETTNAIIENDVIECPF